MKRLGVEVLAELPSTVSIPTYLDDGLTLGVVHFGVGNFHRSHQATYLDRLLRSGLAREWTICGVGLLERDERMRDALVGQDGLFTVAVREPDGSSRFSVIGSIRRFLYAPDEPEAVLDQLVAERTRIVSLTITEGGYVNDPTTGRAPQDNALVAEEVANGLSRPRTAFGWIVAALRERRRRGIGPFTVLSCDNIEGNGQVARLSVLGVAELVDPDLARWIDREVSFPSSMVDRITPVTTEEDIERVKVELGVEDRWPVACEPFSQWVVEDDFVAGRPPLEKAGVTLSPEIDRYEAVKLRLLNGSHQTVSYIGQLLGYAYVHEAAADPRVARFVRAYMEGEGIPTIVPPAGLDVHAYVDELFVRFGNPCIRDALSRLSVDASNRIPKFLVPVLLDRVASGAASETGASILATWRAWCRGVAAGRFSMDDTNREALLAAAAGDPVDFLRGVGALVPFLGFPTFVGAFVRASEVLENSGPDAFLDSFVPGV